MRAQISRLVAVLLALMLMLVVSVTAVSAEPSADRPPEACVGVVTSLLKHNTGYNPAKAAKEFPDLWRNAGEFQRDVRRGYFALIDPETGELISCPLQLP